MKTLATIDFPSVIQKFDKILERGLCVGVGKPDGQMCVEAAITQALGLPFNDEPECVAESVRRYKVRLNDSACWNSPQSRAEALRSIGIAQIGSKGIVNDREFAKRLVEKTIRVLIPMLFRERFPNNAACLAAADKCEKDGTEEAAREAQKVAASASASAAAAAADAAYAAAASAADAAYAASAYDATYAASAANAYAAVAANAYAAVGAAYAAKSDPERYLRLSASLALEVLRELNSPGCAYV